MYDRSPRACERSAPSRSTTGRSPGRVRPFGLNVAALKAPTNDIAESLPVLRPAATTSRLTGCAGGQRPVTLRKNWISLGVIGKANAPRNTARQPSQLDPEK